MTERVSEISGSERWTPKRLIFPTTRESTEASNIKAFTTLQLETLKKEIESGKMSLNTIKKYIESLEEVSIENKPFILWGLLSAMNKMWISLESIKNWKISLKAWVQSIREKLNISSYKETKEFENLLNNWIDSLYFTWEDLQKALLYRTYNSINSYLVTKFEDQNTSTSEYALYLLEKYKIGVQIDPNLSHEEKRDLESKKWSKAYFERINFENESSYKNFIKTIKDAITDNQAEKEFLMWFFDDLYYNKWENINDNNIWEYKNVSSENEIKIFSQLNTLNEEQKYALWIWSEKKAEEIARRWSNNPLEWVKHSIENGWLHIWVILGVIWAIFWWKKWFFWWILAWIWISWGAFSYAWETFWKNNSWKESSNSNKNISHQKPNEKLNDYFSKINFLTETDVNKKEELEKIWWELSKNDTFKTAPTTVLSIFESTPRKTFEEIKEPLQLYWIELTNKNKDYYKTIFAEILRQRKKAWIWEPIPTENIETYLTRSDRKTNTTDTTPVAAWDTTNHKLVPQAVETDSNTWIAELEQLRSQWYTDLYILSRWIELGYTFTKTPPSWIKPNWSMWILGSTWYVIKTPLTIQTYKYLANAGWHFITWWLHRSLQWWNLEKIVWWTWEKLNWIWNKASELLQLEIRKEKVNLEKYLKWIDSTISWNSWEINKVQQRLQALDSFEKILLWWDSNNIRTALNDYKSNFDKNFKLHIDVKNQSNLQNEIQRFKKIEAEIQRIETETKVKIQDLENRVKQATNKQDIDWLRKEAEEFAKKSNIEIERLNKHAALTLSQLDESGIKQASGNSKFVENLVKANGWAENFLAKFNGTWGKAFIWIGIISLLYNGREWLGEMWENGLSEENKNDAIDLWIGFIPVIWGIHDLKIAWDGKDLNDRTLSTGERWLRTAFGIVWLIPWFWVLAKWVFKWSAATIRWADVAIQTTNVVWKWLTYTLLWFSIATATKEIVFEE